jgi:uncharacterized membrane protein
MLTMNKKWSFASILLLFITFLILGGCSSETSAGKNGGLVTPVNGHHYQVQAEDGTMVDFFVLKSADGILRAAIDSCDVCFRSGLGYYQEGDNMVCKNCGQKFASNKINIIKGGCNPAPLDRTVAGDKLVINMRDINMNSWYMKYRKS